MDGLRVHYHKGLITEMESEVNMIPLLEELKALMEIHGLSPGEAAKYIGCSQATAYNWLVYKSSSPGSVYQDRIRQAIRKITIKFERPIYQESKKYYRAVWPKITPQEKEEVIEILNNQAGSHTLLIAYLNKLKSLAAGHNVKVKSKKPGRIK